MKYAIIIEKSATGYSAHAPDLPGVGIVADTSDGARQLIREAIGFHIAGLKKDGQPIPSRASRSTTWKPPHDPPHPHRLPLLTTDAVITEIKEKEKAGAAPGMDDMGY